MVKTSCGEPAISLHSHHVSLVQWTTHLLPVMRDSGSNPQRGVLMWNRDSPISFVSLHWWPRRDWSLWPCLRRALSRTITRPSSRQCDNPTWSYTAFLSRFHTRCRSSFQPHNQRSQLLGGALWRVCYLTSFSPWLTGAVDYPFASCLEGPGFKSPGWYLCETGIFLLALSRYSLAIFNLTYTFCWGTKKRGREKESECER